MTPEEKQVIEAAILWSTDDTRILGYSDFKEELLNSVKALEASRQVAPDDGLSGPHWDGVQCPPTAKVDDWLMALKRDRDLRRELRALRSQLNELEVLCRSEPK